MSSKIKSKFYLLWSVYYTLYGIYYFKIYSKWSLLNISVNLNLSIKIYKKDNDEYF